MREFLQEETSLRFGCDSWFRTLAGYDGQAESFCVSVVGSTNDGDWQVIETRVNRCVIQPFDSYLLYLQYVCSRRSWRDECWINTMGEGSFFQCSFAIHIPLLFHPSGDIRVSATCLNLNRYLSYKYLSSVQN